MNTRSRPWEIAADLETAAKAVREAELALDAIHPSVLPEVEAIQGTEWVNCHMAKALQALSDKYQAIADAEPDGDGRCPECGEDEMDGGRCHYCGFHDYNCGLCEKCVPEAQTQGDTTHG